jgi:uncharacterized membrane protein YqjE
MKPDGSSRRDETATRSASPRDLSTVELVKQIAHESQDLIKAQVELAKTELRADLGRELQMVAGMGVASLSALVGTTLLLVTAILGLATTMPAWLAGLIVSVAVLLFAGIAAAMGWRRRVRHPLARTRRELQEDVRWTKEKMA